MTLVTMNQDAFHIAYFDCKVVQVSGSDWAVGHKLLPHGWRSAAINWLDDYEALTFLRPWRTDQGLSQLLSIIPTADLNLNACYDDPTLMKNLANAMTSGAIWFLPVPRKFDWTNDRSITSASVLSAIQKKLGNKINIDFAKLSSWEGGQYLYGYVPFSGLMVDRASGVTVATGCDLGQMDSGILNEIGGQAKAPRSGQSLTERLKPFVGVTLKGMDRWAVARTVASLAPVPQISKLEANLIDQIVFTEHVRETILARNNYPGRKAKEFEGLTPGQQTVLASVRYQFGNLGDGYKGKFFSDAMSGDWTAAASAMLAWPDDSKRIKQEAPLLTQ